MEGGRELTFAEDLSFPVTHSGGVELLGADGAAEAALVPALSEETQHETQGEQKESKLGRRIMHKLLNGKWNETELGASKYKLLNEARMLLTLPAPTIFSAA